MNEIFIGVNRYTIIKLEEAIEKYNKEHPYSVAEYVEIINRLLEKYVKPDNSNRKEGGQE